MPSMHTSGACADASGAAPAARPVRRQRGRSVTRLVLDWKVELLVNAHEDHFRKGVDLGRDRGIRRTSGRDDFHDLDWLHYPQLEAPPNVVAAALSRGLLRQVPRVGLRLVASRALELVAEEDLAAAWRRTWIAATPPWPTRVTEEILVLADEALSAGAVLPEKVWVAVLPHAVAGASGRDFDTEDVQRACTELLEVASASEVALLLRALVDERRQSRRGLGLSVGPAHFWPLEEISVVILGILEPARPH